MWSTNSPLLFLLLLFSILHHFHPTTSSLPIHLPLHHLPTTPTADPLRHIAALTTSSLARAHHIKNHTHHPVLATPPLSPHSYGGYSISLSFGTPPQTIPLVFDTGSHLVWTPCTHSYLCNNCLFPTALFFPNSSSSVRLIGCGNPKCAWIHSPHTLLSRCRNHSGVCPAYLILYGSGSTGGLLLDDTLHLGGTTVPDFAFGCSVFSSNQPRAGIAGFGRGPAGMLAQLGLERFSYCLISRRYDDVAGEAGAIVLGGAPESSLDGVRFTPFVVNPVRSPFSVYYYVFLREIAVGGETVKVPREMLIPAADGAGGTIVDSGTTFTFMDASILDGVVRVFEEKVAGRYKRSAAAESRTGLKLCYGVSPKEEVELPSLEFRFKGGAKMVMPVENYFAVVSEYGAMCLMVVSDDRREGGGPSIILGAFQQQNYHMVFDVQRQRLGFRRQNCKAGM